ncbi:hypothetical protein [Chryseobacterium cucumeris]|uniref:HNH endonuclease n=1 Tax=Chryseobacterium cucumeris TaxID=1813611 RepID=A0ABX9X9F1_9FLAO|nr:hypothetical protein [Chryseobacterium cucumeris]MDH5033862.1 hypothetical protein [Chryseobacterium cucumeris]ROH94891.1 hypothetical protein EGI15_03265 [Chryseobacterium cucumeris]
MIKIPHELLKLDSMAIDYYKEIETNLQINDKLTNWADDELKPVMVSIHGIINRIITGRPDDLEKVIAYLEPKVAIAKQLYKQNNPLNSKQKPITPSNINTWFKNKVFEVFNYDNTNFSFTKLNKGQLAYDHAQRLDMNTCPYCNANFTFTIKSKKLKSRPQFDHFYNKGKYPYLALSFFNLIPSCALCNSGALKGQKQFSLLKNLHPFLESIDTIYQFRTNIDSADFLVSKKDFDIKIMLCDNKKNSDPDVIKAKANIDTFALVDRYNYHKDIVGAVIKNAHVYCNTAIEDLYMSFDKIFKSEQEVKELVVGNYLDPNNFHQRIHSKLVRDIAEEFGLKL